MSELKMRDALITAREVLVLEGYAEDSLAIVKIDEALAQQPAASTYGTTGQAEFKAFHASLCRRFGYIHDENYWWRDLVSLQEHIAKQVKPAAVVELTDAEIFKALAAAKRPSFCTCSGCTLAAARAVITADRAKNGGVE